MLPRPAVYAHRGASRQETENTVQAFALAAEMGVDGVELDVWRSRDGELIVHHDPDIKGLSIERTTASQLPDYVPTLSAALDVCRGLRVNIEIKGIEDQPSVALGTAEALIDMLRSRSEPSDRWIISSFDHGALDQVRDKAPEFRTGLLFWRQPWLPVLLHAVERGHYALHPHEILVDEALREATLKAAIGLNVWTVNDPVRVSELVDLGIDGLITDVPDEVLQILEFGS
ncbi:MAG: glycerophosphodiester phosphodiesterase [Actinomycetota bacterium]|nr:glycerophosphodiester phosphodiesterase [Actinomycetota bacterium]